MILEELEKRVGVLEDIEAIKKLKARYCQAADDNYNPERFCPLFTEDAVWDGGKTFGVYRGKKAIMEFFAHVSKDITFAVHYGTLVPDITVQGDKAYAHWYGLVPMTLTGGKACWLAHFYDDTCVKIKGEWLIKEIKTTVLFQTPYEEGWAKKPFLD
jgi:uncharacterized protein (TIGR02246 family)